MVIEQEQGLTHPPLLRTACEAMLKKPGALDNPGGYLRSILRRQQRELEGMQQELLELEEAHRQACLYEDPNRADLEWRVERLRAAVEGREPPSEPRRGPDQPRHSVAPPAVTAPSRRPSPEPTTVASSAGARGGPSSVHPEADGLEQTVLRLKRSNLAAAKIVALHLPPEVAARLLAPEPPSSPEAEELRTAAVG